MAASLSMNSETRESLGSIAPRGEALDALLKAQGAQPCCLLPQHIPSGSPLSLALFLALNSPHPERLVQKLIQYGNYFHPGAIFVLQEAGENYIRLGGVVNDAPSFSDLLFQCGVIFHALQRLGCQSLTVERESVPTATLRDALAKNGIVAQEVSDGIGWFFRWQYFKPSAAIDGFEHWLLSRLASVETPTHPASGAARAELRRNLRQHPSLEEVAVELRMSPRALQRKLSAEKTSFTRLLAEVRTEVAEELLRVPAIPMNEISLRAGYADKAHFCREFKKMRNMTPREYREAPPVPKSADGHGADPIFAAVRAVAPELVAHCRQAPTVAGEGAVSLQTCVLSKLMQEKGPRSVLDLAFHLSRTPSACPALFLFLEATTPAGVIEKVARHVQFIHPHVRIVAGSTNLREMFVEVTGGEPTASPAVELFLYGFLRMLLTRLGCRGLQMKWECAGSPDLKRLLTSVGLPPAGEGGGTCWRIRWSDCDIRESRRELDDFLVSLLPPPVTGEPKPLTHAIETLFQGGERTTLPLLAGKMGVSVRTLQRNLAREQTSYRQMFHSARVHRTEQLLRNPAISLTEVGYLAGFTDSSHFYRVFKKVHASTPKEYRDALATDTSMEAATSG